MNKLAFGFGAVIFFLVGCQNNPSALSDRGTERANLKQQAERFWSARVAGDWGSVYDILPDDNVDKKSIREEFIAFRNERGPFRYLSAEPTDVVVSGDIGWVNVSYQVGPTAFPALAPTKIEKWQIWEKKGQWSPLAKESLPQMPTLPPEYRLTPDQAVLTARVEAYWQAKADEEWGAVYEFLEPDFKDLVSKDDFLKNESLYSYTSYHKDWIEAIDGFGRVKISFTYKFNNPSVSKMDVQSKTMIERWIELDGVWYRQLKTHSKK